MINPNQRPIQEVKPMLYVISDVGIMRPGRASIWF